MSAFDTFAAIEGELAEVVERLRASTVQVRVGGRGAGAGVVWRAPAGVVVTNAHVVGRASRAAVELADGRVLDAAVTRRDPRRDLAALAVEATDLPRSVTLGDCRALRPGELVLAVGSPWGVPGALSVGVVHAAPGARAAGRRPARQGRWVLADVRLAPGNSGGPLADARGRVVGVNAMVANGRLALAVPCDEVERFLGGADAGRPTLGISARAAGAGRLLVLEVAPGGAAERAGLIPGDVLVGAGGRPLESAAALLDALADAGPGGALALELVRGGVAERRVVTLAGGPRDTPKAAA